MIRISGSRNNNKEEEIMQKIKVVMVANDLNINGISNVIMSYCSNLNLNEFEVTIMVGSPIADLYSFKCQELGVDIVELPTRKASPLAYYKALEKTLSKDKYDIFHIHGNSATITPELFLAWRNRVPVRIAHSHNTTCNNMRVHKLLLPVFNRLYTHGFSCGEMAGIWLFGDKVFTVMPNGFIPEKFRFNSSDREKTRKELNLADKYVIGHIGRFNSQKNHQFLLGIFEEAANLNDNAWLLLVGNGPDFDEINKLIQKHRYCDRIIVYGETNETARMYAGMDVLVMPSKYEGLPVALLEAQINGLRCVVSDVITREVQFGDILTYMSLKDSAKHWANEALKLSNEDRYALYDHYKEKIEKYDIRENARMIEKVYETLVNWKKR